MGKRGKPSSKVVMCTLLSYAQQSWKLVWVGAVSGVRSQVIIICACGEVLVLVGLDHRSCSTLGLISTKNGVIA